MDIKKWKKYIKKNKKKSSFFLLGGLIILLLVINGLLSLLSGGQNFVMKEAEFFAEADSLGAPSYNRAKTLRSGYSISSSPEVYSETRYSVADDRKIIRNGNLSIIVKDIEETKKEVENIIREKGGFIQSSNFSENENYEYYNGKRISLAKSKTGAYTLRVPVEKFNKTFNELKKIALKVNGESTYGNDVTEQYADLELQLKNKKAEVEQYRKILSKAQKVEDILKVTKYLNNAQGEYERMQGRMNHLNNQVELATINLEIISEKDVELFGVTWSPLKEIKNGFSNMIDELKDFANLVISFFFKLPIYILYLGLIILVGRYGWKLFLKLKKKI